MNTLLQDLHHATRQLARRPLLTATTVLSVALGVGISLAVFTMANTFFGPQGVIQDEQSLLLPASRVSFGDYLSVREQAGARVDVAATRPTVRTLDSKELGSVPLRGEAVSGNYFSVLGLKPAVGRLLASPEPAGGGREATAVISYRCWQERFAGDPGVVGQARWFGARQLNVVGVAPRGFRGMRQGDTELWEFMGPDAVGNLPSGVKWTLLGRGRTNVPVEQARAVLQSAVGALGGVTSETPGRRRARVGLASDANRWRLVLVAILTALSGLVLLVACVNVAGLLAARHEERRSETAVRLALGAGRWTLVRQLLTESFVLVVAGAGLGILAAYWALAALRALLLPLVEIMQVNPQLQLDGRTLLVTLTAIVLATLAAGLMPALDASRADLTPTLQTRTMTIGRLRRAVTSRDALVVLQLALGFGFLSTAAVFMLGSRGAPETDRDRARDGVLVVVFMAQSDSEGGVLSYPLLGEAVDEIRAGPGVAGAALASVTSERTLAHVLSPRAGQPIDVFFGQLAAQPDYFRMKGLRLLRGRLLTPADERHRARVVLISASTARRLWPDSEPLGQIIRMGHPGEPGWQVVGVVDDALTIRDGPQPHPDPDPFLYVPYGPDAAQTPGQKALYVHGSGDTASLATALRRALSARKLGIVVLFIQTLRELDRVMRLPVELGALFVRIVGLLAAALALVGLQGVIARSVERRRREIGVRLALGATPESVLRLILRSALRLTGFGLFLGLAVGIAAVGAVRNTLPGLPPLSLGVLAAVGVTLVAATLGASYLPARRAAGVDPIVTLRCE